VNSLLARLAVNSSGFGPMVARLGDLSAFSNVKYKVKYSRVSGKKSPNAVWQFAVGIPATWTNASLDGLGQLASTPGVPYLALQAALVHFGRGGGGTAAAAAAGLESALQQQQEGSPPSPPSFSEGGTANATNIVYNRMGRAVGTYGLWDAPDGGTGRFAVWKLNGFGILVSHDGICPEEWQQQPKANHLSR